MRTLILGVVAVSIMQSYAALAQSAPARDATTEISKAEIDALAALPAGDHSAKVVDIGKLNVAVGVVHRGATHGKPGDPVHGIAHDNTTEVYVILSGSGWLTTGGKILEPKRAAADEETVTVVNGPSVRGINQGGYTRKVGPGDVVIIPPGVFHGWSRIPDHITYVSVRPDPDRVLPAGYVNPAIKGMDK